MMESAMEAHEAPACNCNQGRLPCQCAISVRHASAQPSERSYLWTDFIVSVLLVLTIVAVCLGLLGCSSVPKEPETIVACSVTRERAFVLNHLKSVAMGLEVAPHQVPVLCAVPASRP